MDKSLRSPLGCVRGLGSAKDGTHHWWAQRVTAIALVPLLIWFVASIVSLAGAPLPEVKAWIASPAVTVLFLALIVATFHHMQLGLQVVIEDYIHAEGTKLALLLLVKGGTWLFGGICALSVLKLAFGG
jgi:succinate dehydrogenase / fumarate reductase membrane anchor subunit